MSTKALHQADCALRTSASVIAWFATTVAEAATAEANKAQEVSIRESFFISSTPVIND
jgi:hypothetical protein